MNAVITSCIIELFRAITFCVTLQLLHSCKLGWSSPPIELSSDIYLLLNVASLVEIVE